ncbi:MAG: TPM domain-containing protein [Chitinophagaceae bacterium]|nr:TPM domain-containing protein [Chitinophagaceae bacterium]MCW5904730.1 TPM domain-containing protein [Chitinophagaceae bacterium]
MLNFFKKKPADFFSDEEKKIIVAAIQQAELNTSGELRVYIENHCSYVNATDRAENIFEQLNMFNTEQRNAVLIYVALKDKQLAIYGDKGIHEKVGTDFWNKEVKLILQFFNKQNYAEGIAEVAKQIGDALKQHFPYNKHTDINELPDDIVFGR